jgi:calcineurin-like phosphoesterase family protein
MDFFLADTHFDHTNIVTYCGRPFKDSKEMDDTIIRNWNQIVKPEDTVYHLGDFALCRSERYPEYIDVLNGRIILIMGNHDRRRTVTFWAKRGIVAYKHPVLFDVSLNPIEEEYWTLSHEPVDEPGIINIHGHTHGNIHRGEVPEKGIHICVSCEAIGYKPVSLDWVSQEIKRREGENGK